MAKGARQVAIVLLGIWLILEGIVTLTGIDFPLRTTILGILALVAGVLLLIGR
ncbi:MAG TPA: hypothetical protein VHM02_09640 [Thermoanaerobaculia bacterium]|nr:hypothetical protein [Thermoanaerobaculia bacterium]